MTRARQRGVTLVELMLALALGLLVLLLAAVLLLSSNASYIAQTEAASVADSGRHALEIIARSARQAAFVNWDLDGVAAVSLGAAPASVVGLDDNTVDKASDGIADPRPGALNGSDVLALRFAGSGEGAEGDGSVLSCGGAGVGERGSGWSIFYVAHSGAGEAELRCKYRGKGGWGADAIVSGVDSFQVLYGLDTDVPADGLANRYLNADALNALDDALALSGVSAAARERERNRKTHWKRITSIKVALLLHGANHARAGSSPAVFDLFGRAHAETLAASDRGTRIREDQMPDAVRMRERQLFSSTILLRNPAL